jgi:hypothetical protein
LQQLPPYPGPQLPTTGAAASAASVVITTTTSTTMASATAGHSPGDGRPAEQGFALISFSTPCRRLETGLSKLVKVSHFRN